ncbi:MULTISPECIES: RnfH family protein [Shewanella]|uniref:RnfH family protein n=2 Tax=Shewanella TaxID=22 RepID=UPI001D9AD615|nr:MULTISPECIES: RnfH family protein [Shewanella]NCQ45600.1 RnfH family protein [Shewanella frigidimarina]NCO71737.1 RnfH family protein [Shewanella vesiculosa]NCP37648.1 RnfH family protein [Shewanella vesiculosa]NCP69378.1 RnfH family protein [Shewanella vesiculosa]NCP75269.1 RnfH family protein [Shewanella vesiculosa]
MMNETENFSVDVIYALPKQQKIISVMVSPGTTFIEAVKQSDIVKFFPDINLEDVKLGVFSRQAKHDEVLVPGQRVEIYRPLIADPKDVRRKRAEKAKDEGRINKITGAKVN